MRDRLGFNLRLGLGHRWCQCLLLPPPPTTLTAAPTSSYDSISKSVFALVACSNSSVGVTMHSVSIKRRCQPTNPVPSHLMHQHCGTLCHVSNLGRVTRVAQEH